MANGLIVLGTDTGCGKTTVSATLARALRLESIDVGVVKPFASGVDLETMQPGDDAAILLRAAGLGESYHQIAPQRFRLPLAPADAARLEGRTVDLAAATSAIYQALAAHSVTVIEGVGGVAVPVTDSILSSDFFAQFHLPALVVARSALGTINHTLLTIEHLRARHVEILGVVFNRIRNGPLELAEEVGPSTAARLAGVENFGIMPFVATDAAITAEEWLNALPIHCDAIRRIVRRLLARK